MVLTIPPANTFANPSNGIFAMSESIVATHRFCALFSRSVGVVVVDANGEDRSAGMTCNVDTVDERRFCGGGATPNATTEDGIIMGDKIMKRNDEVMENI